MGSPTVRSSCSAVMCKFESNWKQISVGFVVGVGNVSGREEDVDLVHVVIVREIGIGIPFGNEGSSGSTN
jgi:hypothetical protein